MALSHQPIQDGSAMGGVSALGYVSIPAAVAFHDPYLAEIPSTRRYADLAGRRGVDPSPGFDLFVLATHHRCYDDRLVDHGVPIVDTRRVLAPHPLVTRA